MKKTSGNSFINQFKVFVFALAFVIGVQYVSAAWTEPSATPPGNNTDTPVNVGNSLQQKLGSLVLNTSTSNPYAVGLTVFGQVQIVDGSQGAGKVLTSDANGVTSWQNGSSGCSASDRYDSGWVSLLPGQTITLNHNLGTTDTVVYLERNITNGSAGSGEVDDDGITNFGTTAFWYTSGQRAAWAGINWYDKTANTISVTRAGGDAVATGQTDGELFHIIVAKVGCL